MPKADWPTWSLSSEVRTPARPERVSVSSSNLRPSRRRAADWFAGKGGSSNWKVSEREEKNKQMRDQIPEAKALAADRWSYLWDDEAGVAGDEEPKPVDAYDEYAAAAAAAAAVP